METSQTSPKVQALLQEYANLTQTLLPNERDEIQIQYNGKTWMVVHLPSKATVRATRARMIQQICRPVAFALALIATTLVIQGFRLAPVPGTRYVGGGIVLLAFAAWLAWFIRVPVPREDT